MSDVLARARARALAGEWLASYVGEQDPAKMRFSQEELLKAFAAGYAERIHRDILAGDEIALTLRVLTRAVEEPGDPANWLTKSDCVRAAACVAIMREALLIAEELIGEAASLFRIYEEHHRARAESGDHRYQSGVAGSLAKAKRNGDMADKLEDFLAPPANPADVLRGAAQQMADAVGLEVDHAAFDQAATYLAEPVDLEPGDRTVADCMAKFAAPAPGNVRPVTSGPLADPAVVTDLMESAGLTITPATPRHDWIDHERARAGLPPRDPSAFALSTADPRFDPAQPVCVNGYLYHPAKEN